MASVSHEHDWLSNFSESFSRPERMQMVEEDIFAGTSVSLLLASVIGIGVLLALVSVTYVLW